MSGEEGHCGYAPICPTAPVELQSFWRLPRSNALAFPIRCYLISLNDLVSVPKWGRRFHGVLLELPEDLARDKGFAVNRPLIVDFLAGFDDGAPTTPGIYPDLVADAGAP